MPDPERTSDGRWIVIDGRRWRATDPSIPHTIAMELVDELMAQRRAVGAARRSGDAAAEKAARARVHLAKVALGERGEPWWEQSSAGQAQRVRAAIMTLANHRGPAKSICPSDAARAVGGSGWRDLVPIAQGAAQELARSGVIRILQKGSPIDAGSRWSGPVRLQSTER